MDGSVSLVVKVLGGRLSRDVIIQFETINNSAVSGGKIYTLISTLAVASVHTHSLCKFSLHLHTHMHIVVQHDFNWVA